MIVVLPLLIFAEIFKPSIHGMGLAVDSGNAQLYGLVFIRVHRAWTELIRLDLLVVIERRREFSRYHLKHLRGVSVAVAIVGLVCCHPI